MTKKQKLRYIRNSYDKIDIMTMEALASCAIEGNPMQSRVCKVYRWIWDKSKPMPTDLEIDSVYKLMKRLEKRK